MGRELFHRRKRQLSSGLAHWIDWKWRIWKSKGYSHLWRSLTTFWQILQRIQMFVLGLSSRSRSIRHIKLQKWNGMEGRDDLKLLDMIVVVLLSIWRLLLSFSHFLQNTMSSSFCHLTVYTVLPQWVFRKLQKRVTVGIITVLDCCDLFFDHISTLYIVIGSGPYITAHPAD